MNFTEIAELRQSCRSYDPTREVESEEIADIPLPLGRLRPKEGGFFQKSEKALRHRYDIPTVRRKKVRRKRGI